MKRFMFLLFIIYGNAQADILVLNFNKNNSTVAAAKRAAKARGEKVIELPTKKGEKIDQALFEKTLNQMQKENKNLSSIVFSGHDGSGMFSGSSGSLSRGQVSKAMQKFPNVANQVKSLLLRGCYTATVLDTHLKDDSLDNSYHWRKTFPNLNMIAGYSGSAPSSEKKHSKAFVEEALTLEKQMYLSKSIDELAELFKSINYSKWTTNSLSIRTCAEPNTTLYSSMTLQNKGHNFKTYDELVKLCDKKELEKQHEVYTNYLYAFEKEYETPPKEKQGTDLRKAYTYLQEYSFCMGVYDIDRDIEKTLEQIPRLLYWDYIVENFTRHNQDLLEDLKHDITIYNTISGENLAIPDFKTASRQDVLQFIHKLYEVSAIDIYGKNNYSYGLKTINYLGDSIKRLQNTANYLQETLFKLDSAHVPFDWVADKHSPVVPSKTFITDYSTNPVGQLHHYEETPTTPFENLDVRGKMDTFFITEDKEAKNEMRDKIIEETMFLFLKDIESTPNIDEIRETLFSNLQTQYYRFIDQYSSPQFKISANNKFYGFVSEILVEKPYEAFHIALRYPEKFSKEEITGMADLVINSQEYKEKPKNESLRDLVNSMFYLGGKGDHKFKEIIKDKFPTYKALTEEFEKELEED